MAQLLSVRRVSKIYGQGPNRVVAVNQVSLEICSGEVVLILGPSGSGKTTLLSIMGCLLRPTHGEVFANGQNVNQLSDRELSRLRREQIGFVFQSFNLLNFLSVRKNVEVALNLTGVRGRPARERAVDLLRQVKLDHRLDFRPQDLSGGEKQRVSIARALANNPKLILADEPTGNLDSKIGRIVVDLLTGLARERGSGVVMVTHDNRVLDVADRVLHLSDGSLTMDLGQRKAALMTTDGVTQIRIKGHLGPKWSAWFEELTIKNEPNGEAVLVGPVADQAALHGILMKIRNLGLPLISVNRVDSLDE